MIRHAPAGWLAAVALLGAAAALPSGAVVHARAFPAQKSDEERADPYTRGEPEALAAAGYVALAPHGPGPLRWSDRATSEDIEKILGDVTMRWVETAHFRIGSSLPEYRVPHQEKDALRDELEALEEFLPRVDPRARKLDPWLRLHLFARRLEALHAEFSGLLGVTDADFAGAPAAAGERYVGEGPHLGMPGKFTVLLFEKEASLGRYRTRFTEQPHPGLVRCVTTEPTAMALATALEWGRGATAEDAALHAHVVFHATHNLVVSYKYFAFTPPVWLSEGLSHWFRRRVHPDWNQFSAVKGDDMPVKEEESWPARVRARVKHEYFPPASELMRWTDVRECTRVDHLMMWSRVDYLLAREPGRFARFMDLLKADPWIDGRALTPDEVAARQDAALQEAFGLDAQSFDERWAEWVLATYPKG